MAEPRILVSETEWRRELGKIGAVVRERKKAEREWGRYASPLEMAKTARRLRKARCCNKA